MALGKEVGTFDMKITSWSQAEDGGSVAITVDGAGTNFGTVLGTLTGQIAPGAKNGAASWRSQAFLDNGEVVQGRGEGTWTESGKHKWRIRLIVTVSDDRLIAVDGTLNLKKRSLSGKILDWS
jgi:hypothetical protein